MPYHDMIPVEVGAVVPEGIFLTDGMRLLVQCFLKYICATCAASGIYGSQGERQGKLGANSGRRGSDILISNKIRSVRL
jgi:hypothetical protein